MKKKLISYNAFNNILENSFNNIGNELNSASPYVATALGVDNLNMVSYDANQVIYGLQDGSYIKADYSLENNDIVYENFEHVVIDEDTEKSHVNNLTKNLYEAIVEKDGNGAEEIFKDIIQTSYLKRKFLESCKKTKKSPLKKKKKSSKLTEAIIANKNLHTYLNKLSKNIYEALYFRKAIPIMKESFVVKKEGKIKVPTSKKASSIISMQYGANYNGPLQTVLRCEAKKLLENNDFIKRVTRMRRENALSDYNGLERAIEETVTMHPSVFALTEKELMDTIAEALDIAGENNYDAKVCKFLAEGVLRNAFESNPDKVKEISNKTGVRLSDYETFKETINDYYPSLDQSIKSDMQLHADLYNALREVREIAINEGELKSAYEIENHLDKLKSVIDLKSLPNLNAVKEAVNTLNALLETNLETKPWDVSYDAHTTIDGNHPRMSELAKHSYTPSSDFDASEDPAPVSADGKYKLGRGANSAREMRYKGLGNRGKEVYPKLNNPYVPEAGIFRMQGAKSIDQDDTFGNWKSEKTYPELSNPYVIKGE